MTRTSRRIAGTVRRWAALAGLGALLLGALLPGNSMAQAAPKVIVLIQVPCQFIQSENGVDHGYVSQRKEDCDAINARTGQARLAKVKTMVLAPGRYIFRVTNRNVPYELGFWLRGAGLVNRAVLPSVSGGGLTEGTTQDYVIELEPGKYVYSCPLNTTPDYPLIVR